ncbi:SHOCT domain-containing protein [Pseudonocardia acaciae]|uniref:SHOCT domain-containing protein n=1 Tax=Pseudonocardia acaciae TaxID=551276 RepID=UPI001FDFDCAB|nr:SHOCT domain-containing protein [Pseudonocardia acaciae]
MGTWGAMVTAVSTVLFWVLIIAGIVLLVRAQARPDRTTPGGRPTPERLLAGRFARGEIDEDEYRQRLDVLRGQHRPLPR